MSVSTIKLIMPKFKIEALVELQDVFKKMGNETNKKINKRFKNDCYNTFIFAIVLGSVLVFFCNISFARVKKLHSLRLANVEKKMFIKHLQIFYYAKFCP